MLRRLALRFEGGAMYSLTVRELYRRHHDLEVGLYTIGPCEAGPAGLDPGTSIGRYCSIYYTVRTITLDEAADDGRGPVLAFGSAVNGAGAPAVARHELQIGNDVFIGHNSIILPSTGSIGDGAFIGAGSVVQTPVPPYGVVMGNPARVVRYRFSENKIQELLASRWWLKSALELRAEMDEFRRPLEGDTIR
jgi:virginiamycin A acetyltransferase